MNKTIKVIDLLNKIANGEEVPEKIKYNGIIYKYCLLNKQGLKYVDLNEKEDVFYKYLTGTVNNLNDEVEIIEESEQEIDIQDIVMMDLEKYGFDNKDEFAIDLTFKINELVRAIKQLDRKYKEKNEQ